MTKEKDILQRERDLIQSVRGKGTVEVTKAYVKLSGPGWLQSAITLGGGSLSSSLYLGVLAGFGMLWLQPFAMILGIIMLSGISYVTLSTGERPFQAINRHINPVLGWSWALASLAANMVWSLPQYSLATGVLQQNLFPELLGGNGGKIIICICILIATISITWCYDSGSWGIKLYERILKGMVALIVLSFFGVVVKLSFSGDGLQWGSILSGLIPDLSRFNEPAEGFKNIINQIPQSSQAFWTELIVTKQRDVMISAAATAVGINMTFLLPYSMLSKGWNKDFRDLAVFDLSTGMLIPFVLATSCVVIAAASQFHLQIEPGFLGERDAAGELIVPGGKAKKDYYGLIDTKLKSELGSASLETLKKDESALTAARNGLSPKEKELAAMLANRDVKDLAKSLKPLTGDKIANWVFGLGVLGMALSTITLLMLISGFVICEMLGVPAKGWAFKLSTLAATTGVLGPFLWTKAAAYLAVPTSVFGMVLLPIAYITFLLMMNNKAMLGENMPTGIKRIIWNILMSLAAATATAASLFVINQKVGMKGFVAIGLLLTAALVVHFTRKKQTPTTR